MVQLWMRWCRLCAREDQNNSHINILLKDEEGPPLSDAIHKYYSIDIKDCENLPNVICYECYCLIRTTMNLNQRIPKVNAMFEELQQFVKSEDEYDPETIKTRHNLQLDFNILAPLHQMENIKTEDIDTYSEKEEEINELDDDDGNKYDNLHFSDEHESSNDNECSTSLEKNIKLEDEEQEEDKEDLRKIKKKYKSRKMRSPTEDKTKSHHCSECQKGFKKFYNYRQHMQSTHGILVENKRQVLICGKCGKECKSISSLKEHEFTHSEERTFKCTNCEKAFKSIRSLKQHEDTHNETRYICVICGLQLNTQQTLRKHMVVHSDEKNYKCDYCGNEYKRVKALKAHLILHTGLRPYTCDFCPKTFANVSNCRGHKKKNHPIELAALEASGINKVSTTVVPKLNELKAITASKAEFNRLNGRGKDLVDELCQ